MGFDPQPLKNEFSIFRSCGDLRPLHYLDNAAMAQIPDPVLAAMIRHETTRRANVKRGIHALAEAADAAFEAARAQVAGYLGVDDPDEVVFTSGTTAGINMVAQGLGATLARGDEVLLSVLEHHSNIVPWQMLARRRGIRLQYLPATPDGRVDADQALAHMSPRTKIVALTHGSNVTGAWTDAAALARLAHERGAVMILDGAQTVPTGPLDLPALEADGYIFSGHKVYGPTGVGVLWARKEILDRMAPVFGGGEMILEVSLDDSTYLPPPHRFEAGTPPVTQVIGLAAALGWLQAQDLPAIHDHLERLTHRMMTGLTELDPVIRILGPPSGSRRLPLVSFTVEGVHPHDICQVMSDRYGVALRGGFHCAQPLHDLWQLDGSTRASLAAYNTDLDVDAFLSGMAGCLALLR